MPVKRDGRGVLRACLGALVVLLAAGGAATPSSAQVTGRGMEFWGCWPRSHLSLETSAELVVMSDEATDFVVDGAFAVAATRVAPGAPVRIPIPQTLRIAALRMVVSEGFHVRSLGRPISVLFRVPQQAEASDDIARLLPTSELGVKYLATSYPASLPGEPSFYAVTATEDGTTVTAEVPCQSASDVVVLNAGQVYQVACQWLDVPPDVTGASISADKPIAVLAGNSDAFVPTDFLSGDFVVEAMIPTTAWGNKFFVGPLPKGPFPQPGAHDVLRIVTSGPGNAGIDTATSSTTVALGARGSWLDLDMTEATSIRSDVPVSVHIFATGVEMSDFGDPFMSEVPPQTDWTAAYRVFIPPDYTLGSFLSVVADDLTAPSVTWNGTPVTGWMPLAGGFSWALVALGQQGPEHLVSASAPFGLIVHGANDTYRPEPGLGRVPGSYGYPPPASVPPCVIFPRIRAPATACVGQPLGLSDGGTVTAACTQLEYRWLASGVPVAGCDVFGPDPSCSTTFAGTSTYTLEARCVSDPSCVGSADLLIVDEPAPPVALAPDPASVCAGAPFDLNADPGFTSYAWSSVPDDPGVTPRTGTSSTLTVTPDVDTVYTVVASDGRGCTSQDTLLVTALPDRLPPPVDASLRVTKSGPRGVRLTWMDIPAVTVGGYEAVFLECADRNWRVACAGRLPDPATIQASPPVGPPVATGVEAMVQSDALDRGRLIFYKVRGLSPCALRHGPTCNGFPHQLPPCTPP